jgi:serine phosphatase RsbU (regulator of sigma subunit)
LVWALLFVLVALLGVGRHVLGFGSGFLPLLAAVPALAAVAGGLWYVLTIGAEALVVAVIFLAEIQPGGRGFPAAVTTTVAVAVVTAAGALITTYRSRRERELAQVRLVAEAAQQVVLRPVPREAGPVRFSVLYVSASEGARVGRDLYEVVRTPRRSRIEGSLCHQFSPEDFVTAILADIAADGVSMELIGCGHPAPVLLAPAGPRLIAGIEGGLPLGLGALGGEPRCPVSIPLAAGDQVLFYTDGMTEARNSAGEFFPLLGSGALRTPHPPDTLLRRLSSEMLEFTGHAPADDVALLLVTCGQG